MIILNGIGITSLLNGETLKQTLDPANETVGKGIYAATTLSAVDADLATANILSGITMFGFAGAATVQDIADANAVLADVKAGRTFYSVTGGRKTGNLATVSLSAAANAYPAGYHAGAASLTAVDADLATGNIKSGITIFGVAGSANVRDISDADLVIAEAPTGKTFYAVSGARKTGTGTKTLSAANEDVAAGYYALTTLSAVDVDLAAGNIADGVTIFGFLGTFTGGALAEDVLTYGDSLLIGNIASGYGGRDETIAALSERDLATTTDTYDASSLAVISGVANCRCSFPTKIKLRLYVDGVQRVESAFLSDSNLANFVMQWTQALSGSKICKLAAYNYDSGTGRRVEAAGLNGDPLPYVIVVGSVKN